MSAKPKMKLKEQFIKLKNYSPEFADKIDDIAESTLIFFPEKRGFTVKQLNLLINNYIKPFRDRKRFGKFFEIISKSGTQNKKLEYATQFAEYVDRLADIFFFTNAFLKYRLIPHHEQKNLSEILNFLTGKIISGLNWFGEQGKKDDINALYALTPTNNSGIQKSLNKAQEKMIERNFLELLDFFDLTPQTLNQAIKLNINSIYNDIFEHQSEKNNKKISDIFNKLYEIKEILQASRTQDAIATWLKSRSIDFNNFTPHDLLIRGQFTSVLNSLRLQLVNISVNNEKDETSSANMIKIRVFTSPTNIEKSTDYELLEIYPAFQIIKAPENAIVELAKKFPVEVLENKNKLGNTPSTIYNLKSHRFSSEGVRKMFNKVVKFIAPVKNEWLQRLEKEGVELIRPISGLDFVVAVESEEIAKKISDFEEIANISDFVPKFNIRPQFLHRLNESVTDDIIKQSRINAASKEFKTEISSIPLPGVFTADFFSSTDCQKAAEVLSKTEIKIISYPSPTKLTLDISEAVDVIEALRNISQLSGLKMVEEKNLPKLFNNIARELIGKEIINPINNNNFILTGENEIITIADTGLDTGDEATIHLDFQNRIVGIQSYPIDESYSSFMDNAGDNDGAADKYSGHGTHVAGSALGNGQQAELSGIPSIKGMAPNAKLFFQAVEQTPKWNKKANFYYLENIGKLPPTSGLYGIPEDLKILFLEAYEKGSRIHSNSWGSGRPGEYDSKCEDLDSFVWDHKDFLILVAAGNSGTNNYRNQGIELYSIASPGTAKNCLTIGACENYRVNTHKDTYGEWWKNEFPHLPFSDDQMCDDFNDIAAFSSRGHCLTMRNKPDVVTPGTFILSTRSSQIPKNNFAWGAFTPAKNHYMYMGGTSMSTPLVAGAAALVREFFRTRKNLEKPSAALLKATIIHSADYCDYRYKHPSSNRWLDNEQGWGRVNLINTICPPKHTKVHFYDETVGLETGQEKIYQLEVSDSSTNLKVIMTYMDYPGESLINNLNLILFSPSGKYFFGNDFENNNKPDEVNNVEGIVIENPERGIWTVKVIASSVSTGFQDFAVVISGNLNEQK